MFYALSWFVVFGLLAMWSLASWALHSFAVWSASNVGALAGHSGAIEALIVPGWLAPWIPPEAALAFKSMLSALTPVMESVLTQAPSWVGGLSLAVWVLWGIGCVLLVALGGVLHGLIAMLRRRACVPAA